MKKSLKYALLLGVGLGLGISGSPRAEFLPPDADKIVNVSVDMLRLWQLAYKSIGVPLLDVASVPMHGIVALMQWTTRDTTDREKNLKEEIQPRMSVKEIYWTQEDYEAGKDAEKIDAKLSRIPIESPNEGVKEGLVGTEEEEISEELTEDGEKKTSAIAADRRIDYTSSAGSREAKEAYEMERKYTEQENAIRMLALAVSLRGAVKDKLKGVPEATMGAYEASGGGKSGDGAWCINGCVKWDLDDEENASSTISNRTDYNQALRQYVYYSMAYDQLLSLEQQILGLRLQARGSRAEQSVKPVSDQVEVGEE